MSVYGKKEYELVDLDEEVKYTSIGSRCGSYIIMGKDKNNTTNDKGNTPYPGKSNNPSYGASSIDLFAGLNVINENNTIDRTYNDLGEEEIIYLNSDFSKDAARVYISERSDPDAYFNILASEKSPANYKMSTVTVLSDATRIIGRNSLKMVTSGYGTLNSNNDSSATIGGIHLIAGNSPDLLQPFVKGDNLVEYLKEQNNTLKSIVTTLNNVIKFDIVPLWACLSDHIHIATGPGAPTSPSQMMAPRPGAYMAGPIAVTSTERSSGIGTGPVFIDPSYSAQYDDMQRLLNEKKRITMMQKLYLTPSGNSKYINSKWNMAN